MNQNTLSQSAFLLIHDPRAATAQIISARIPNQALWMVIALVAIVGALLLGFALNALPVPNDEMGELMSVSPVKSAPLLFGAFQCVRAALLVYFTKGIGAAFGGRGQLEDILAATALFQVVAFAGLVGLVVLGALLPVVSVLGLLAYFAWYIWAVVNVIDTAHGLMSPMKSLGVVILSSFAAGMAASILLGIITPLFV